jgi:RNA polymerase sigma factor (sigma-70 family)
MKYAQRIELFEKTRAKYSMFLLSVLWKLTGDKELFTEAMQYALLGMWEHIEKLSGKKAGAYIYRIALTANSRAWRNRIGKDGQISQSHPGLDGNDERLDHAELVAKVRQAIAHLPDKQATAVVMRYLQQQEYDAIAEKLRCGQDGARSHVSKALAALKAKFAVLTERE